MKLFPTPLVVNEDDGFKDDLLQRSEFGSQLLSLVKVADELVISIDGGWGEGKTTFVRMWQGQLKNAGIKSVYVDAFQRDYFDDAFIAIMGSIVSGLQEDLDQPKELARSAARVMTKIIGGAIKIGIKQATLGALSGDEFSNIAEDVAGELSGGLATLVEQRLQSFNKEAETIAEFKKLLENLPGKLKGNFSSGKLVVVIDELDRCRPDFAVEILEKIKHLFLVKNIVFVLVMNKTELMRSIRSVYGEIDAYTYLQKFASIETKLPSHLSSAENITQDYLLAQMQKFEIAEKDQRTLVDHFSQISRDMRLSLRDVDKILTYLVVLLSTDVRNFITIDVPLLVAVMKVKKAAIVDRISARKISSRELLEELSLQEIKPWIKTTHMLLLSPAELSDLNAEKQNERSKYTSRIFLRFNGIEDFLPYMVSKLHAFNVK